MADQETEKDTSVLSRITLFNEQAEQHRQWQLINPFCHCRVKDVPKRSFQKDQYGTPPPGSRSEQRALQAQVLSLQEMLRLCELISEKGQSGQDEPERSLKFGELFELYNQISDKLLGTLLCARRHKYVDFKGETLFQGRDEAEIVRLRQPIDQLRDEILAKIANLSSANIVKPVEPSAIRDIELS